MTVKEMMDNVIKQLGFESPLTVMFCEVCESGEFTNEQLMRLMYTIVKGEFTNEQLMRFMYTTINC